MKFQDFLKNNISYWLNVENLKLVIDAQQLEINRLEAFYLSVLLPSIFEDDKSLIEDQNIFSDFPTDNFFSGWGSDWTSHFLLGLKSYAPTSLNGRALANFFLGICEIQFGDPFKGHQILYPLLDFSPLSRHVGKALCPIQLTRYRNPLLTRETMERSGISIDNLSSHDQGRLLEFESAFPPLIVSPTVDVGEHACRDEDKDLKICLFIKTYPVDYDWLRYCLRSVEKFVTGYSDIVLVTDDKEESFPPDVLLQLQRLGGSVFFTQVPSITTFNKGKLGYWWQQVCKLEFYKYTKSNYAFFIDSDCFFSAPFNIQKERFSNGSPIILKNPWKMESNGITWRYGVEYFLGGSSRFSYMRRNGLIMTRSVLLALHKYTQLRFGKCLEDIFMQDCPIYFSEFEIFGEFAFRYFDSDFTFTEDYHRDSLVQYRSWDGLSEDLKNKMSDILQSGE